MSDWIVANFWLIFAGFVLVPVVLCAGHLTAWGPVGMSDLPGELKVLRFNRWNRILHWIRLVTFFVVIICGALALQKVAGGKAFGGIHEGLSKLFLLASIVALVYYFKDMLPHQYDLQWLTHLGGYFSRTHQSYPAGRFNAGQKISFWLTLILVLTSYISGDNLKGGGNDMLAIHIVSSLVLLAVILVHAYLGTLANPGTGGVILNGKVSEDWARHHHPLWAGKRAE